VTQRSWQGAAGLAVTATPFGQAFYDHLATGDGEFEIDLLALDHEGTPVAFLVGIIAEGVYHAFETGFDRAWGEQSPGLTLHFLALERLHAEGVREFDFGHAHGYKDRFEPQLREVTDLRVLSASWLGHWEDASTRLTAWVSERRASRAARVAASAATAADPKTAADSSSG
jgi:CelD/BcsL family acetyltransferase involved in cellulose biosynthesis